MGQLERYALYVLVLVIFLILGVAMWGGDAESPTELPQVELPGPNELLSADPPPAKGEIASSGLEEFDDLFKQYEPVTEPGAAARPAADTGGNTGVTEAMLSKGAESPAPRAGDSSSQRSYTVRANDTLGEIAQRELGSFVHWKKIVELNPSIDPKRLQKGSILMLPSAAELGQTAQALPAAGSNRKHVVQANEYPGSISKKYYGTARLAQHILEANGIRDATKLIAGKTIIIPPKPESGN